MSLSETVVIQFAAQLSIRVTRQWKFTHQHFLLNLILTSGRVEMPNREARNFSVQRVLYNHEVTAGVVFHVRFVRLYEMRD
jgi:hypothetical protein